MMYSERYEVILYASNMDYIRQVIGGEFGWIETAIPRNALVVIDTHLLEVADIVPLRWRGNLTLCA